MDQKAIVAYGMRGMGAAMNRIIRSYGRRTEIVCALTEQKGNFSRILYEQNRNSHAILGTFAI